MGVHSRATAIPEYHLHVWEVLLTVWTAGSMGHGVHPALLSGPHLWVSFVCYLTAVALFFFVQMEREEAGIFPLISPPRQETLSSARGGVLRIDSANTVTKALLWEAV